MKVVGLVSGGKDSCYNLMECIKLGHEIIALANLMPPSNVVEKGSDEIDSFMFQTVGFQPIELYSKALGLPLYRMEINGSAKIQSIQYSNKKEEEEKSNNNNNHQNSNENQQQSNKNEDEVESLFRLLSLVKEKHPDLEAVSSGAILSNYQRNRVENVCSRLGLISLAFLWQRDQSELFLEMIENGVNAVLVKVAGMGLNQSHLLKPISSLFPLLSRLNAEYGINVCGEGGEYETLTLDCPNLFKKKIVIDKSEVIIHQDDSYAPVCYVRISNSHLEDKIESNQIQISNQSTPTSSTSTTSTNNENSLVEESTNPKIICSISKSSSFYKAVAFVENNSIKSHSFSTIANQLFSDLNDSLERKGESLKKSLTVSLYVSEMNKFEQINKVYKKWFDFVGPPSRATLSFGNVFDSILAIEIIGKSTNYSMNSNQQEDVLHVQSISRWAPACIGPYSQSKSISKLIFLAGQIGLQSELMKLAQTPIQQTLLSIKHLRSVAKAVKSDFCKIESKNSSQRKKVLFSDPDEEDESSTIENRFKSGLGFLTVFTTSKSPSTKEVKEIVEKETNLKFEEEEEMDLVLIGVGSLPRDAFIEMQSIHFEIDSDSTTIERWTSQIGHFKFRFACVDRQFILVRVCCDDESKFESLVDDFQQFLSNYQNYSLFPIQSLELISGRIYRSTSTKMSPSIISLKSSNNLNDENAHLFSIPVNSISNSNQSTKFAFLEAIINIKK